MAPFGFAGLRPCRLHCSFAALAGGLPHFGKGGLGGIFRECQLRWRMPLRGADCGCGARMPTALADATAWQQMEGFRPLHDGQEDRPRPASLHPPAAPTFTTIDNRCPFCQPPGSPQCALHGP